MATQKADKPNRIIEILKKEYRWESFLLLGLSIVVLNLFGLLVKGTLSIDTEVKIVGPILGTYPLITNIVLAVLGVVGVIVAVWPILKPSLKETKRLTVPTKGVFWMTFVKVLSFTIFLTVVFVLYDTLVSYLIGLVQ